MYTACLLSDPTGQGLQGDDFKSKRVPLNRLVTLFSVWGKAGLKWAIYRLQLIGAMR